MIPLHEPAFIGKEKQYLNECIDSTYVSTVGKFVNKFENNISKFIGSKYALALNSGTAALHLSLILANVKKNDEVIVPSITFIAPINSIKYLNANPVFIDTDNYFNLNYHKLIKFIKEQTRTIKKNNKLVTYNIKTNKIIKAIILVHCFGNLANVIKVKKILKNKNIKIIEDSAESFGSYFNVNKKKIYAGTIGDIGCLSFNGNKIITSGGGGMLLTNNKNIYDRGKYYATQAKNDNLKYIHDEVGYNYKMTNIQAALGLGQFEKIQTFIKKKIKINFLYKQYLNNSVHKFYINENPVENNAFSINWLNILRFDNTKISPQLIIQKLKKNNIEARHVWYPNHLQKPYKYEQKFEITNSKKLVETSVCLPSSYSLKEEDIKKITKILNNL